jgi:hypothetical protein
MELLRPLDAFLLECPLSVGELAALSRQPDALREEG